MGEKGVNLTGTSFLKPTVFEICAQESLTSALEPAFHKIVTVLAALNPAKFGWFLKWKDESFLLLNGALQHYYLTRHGASLSEKFYGLKRVSLKDSNIVTNISQKQKAASLILLVLFPYLNGKLQNLRREFSEEGSSQDLSKLKRNVIKGLLKMYFVCDTIREMISLQNLLLYMSGKSQFPSPFLKFLDVSLSYSFVRPTVIITEILYKIKEGTFTLSDSGTVLEEIAAKALEFGAFFFRFFQYWQNENYDRNLSDLPIPVPPNIAEDAKQLKGLCPICKKTFRTRTVISTSGYIFCYHCILPVINRYGKCPVTNYPATEDDLIRLYEQ